MVNFTQRNKIIFRVENNELDIGKKISKHCFHINYKIMMICYTQKIRSESPLNGLCLVEKVRRVSCKAVEGVVIDFRCH
jgi:hypothetical protein